MAFTDQNEVDLCNMALNRIAGNNFTLANQTSVAAIACNLHYAQVRDAMLRSYLWNFAKKRITLNAISNMVLSTAPEPDFFEVGDVIVGISSGATAKILAVNSGTEYEIYNLVGTFTDGEVITNGLVSTVYYNGLVVTWENDNAVYSDTASASQLKCAIGYPAITTHEPDYEYSYQYMLPDDFLRLIKVYQDDGTDLPEDRISLEGGRILTNYSELQMKYVSKITDTTKFDSLFTELFILKLALVLVNPIAGIGATELKADIKQDLKMAEGKARAVTANESDTSGYSSFNMAQYTL